MAGQMGQSDENMLQHKSLYIKFHTGWQHQISGRDFVLISQSVYLYSTATSYICLFFSKIFL